jgi:alkylhydroperoxidase family enzyme
MPPRRSCNIRILEDTGRTYRGVRSSLPPSTQSAISRALRAAQAAASRGHCADMHRHAQSARGLLERRLDALLGRR